jgi:serine/threonine-protein kinase
MRTVPIACETTSPELVAGAEGIRAVRPWIAASVLGVVLLGLGLTWYTEGIVAPATSRIPMPKTPAELQLAAQEALTAAGYTQRGAGRAISFVFDEDYFRHAQQTDASLQRWDDLATVTPSPLWFWYREAAGPMSPTNNFGRVRMSDPPLVSAGMTRVRLDPSGRLQELVAVPADDPDAKGPWAEPDWMPLFTAAGLTKSEWTPAEPRWPPPEASDVRRAWTSGNLRIEAASFRGRPTWFRIVPPWRQPLPVNQPAPQVAARILDVVRGTLALAIVIAVVYLARRHVRQGRAELRGATRLATAFVLVGVCFHWVRLDNPPGNWFTVWTQNLAISLSVALVLWAGYLAVEPYVRRWWPNTLVAWSRLLDGRFRDPMIGRNVLFGAALGLAYTFGPSLSVLLHMRPPTAGELGVFGPMSWISDRYYLAALLQSLSGQFTFSILVVLVLFVLRVVARRAWLTYLLFYAFLALLAVSGGLGVATWTDQIVFFALSTLMLLILTKLGLLAWVVAMFYASLPALTLTADRQSWFFHQSVITMALFAGIAIYGAWVSIGNQKALLESSSGRISSTTLAPQARLIG